MADPKRPRRFSEGLKRQIVQLYDNGKSARDIKAEHGIGHSTLHRWVKPVHGSGSTRAADNRTPEQARILEPERENKQLRMEAGALRTAAPIFARKQPRQRRTPAVTRYQRNAGCRACRGRPTAGCGAGRPPGGGADPIAADAGRALPESGGRYGARRTKAAPARRGAVASRRRMSRAMRASGLASCHAKARLRPHPGKPSEADLPSIPNRELDGHGPRARVVGGLACVRVRGAWCLA